MLTFVSLRKTLKECLFTNKSRSATLYLIKEIALDIFALK